MTDTDHTVMVVEDDEGLREILAELIEDAGYCVIRAENGVDALNQLASGVTPSVILLDLMMPVMDGWEFRTRQRATASLAAIPVIVMTAARDPKLVDGEAPVLSKPVRIDAVLEMIRCHAASNDVK